MSSQDNHQPREIDDIISVPEGSHGPPRPDSDPPPPFVPLPLPDPVQIDPPDRDPPADDRPPSDDGGDGGRPSEDPARD